MPAFRIEDELRSDMVRSVHRWWLGKSAGDVPDRAAFDPVEFKDLLPNLFLADLEPEPFRVRYRLMGTRAVEATGMDVTGRYLDELMPSDIEEPWMDHYRRVFATRRPMLGWTEVPTTSGSRFTYEFGLFPLRNGGTGITQVLAIEDYFDLTSTLLELVEWRDACALRA